MSEKAGDVHRHLPAEGALPGGMPVIPQQSRNLKRLVEWLAIAGAVSVTAGVTLASYLFGAHSVPYYAALLLALLFLFPIVSHRISTRAINPTLLMLLLIVPVALWSAQKLFLPSLASPELTSGAFTVAMGATIFLAAGIGAVRPIAFKRAMAVVAVLHILICLYSLKDYQLTLFQSESRYRPEGLRPAVWGEIALGTVIAAILSERRLLIASATFVGLILVVATQMRGAGIAMLAALAIYFWMSTAQMTWPRRLVLLALLAIGVYAMIDPRGVYDIVAQVLLLEHRRRGIDGGFSGRIESIAAGWQIFLQSPLIGVGPSHEIAGNTHNGLVKALAEYGMFYPVLLLVLFARAMQSAWNRGHAASFATMVSFMLFIMAAPRYVNFQIMPFLGLAAAAFALIALREPARRAAGPRRLAGQPGGAAGHGVHAL